MRNREMGQVTVGVQHLEIEKVKIGHLIAIGFVQRHRCRDREIRCTVFIVYFWAVERC